MGKPDQESAAAEEARRATGDAAGRGRGGRLSARRKRETVLRLLRGEDLESVSRELGITAARAAQWRDQFLAAGQAIIERWLGRRVQSRHEPNRRRSRSRGMVFYRVLELAVAHDPVRYRDLIVDPTPKMKPPAPPRTRGHPASLERPPANRPWRVASPASASSG